MHIKKRTLVRVLFIIIFAIVIATIIIKYSYFEQRILLFEMFRGMAFFYVLVVEFPIALIRNRHKSNDLWKQFVLFSLILFAFFSIYVVGANIYDLTKDVFKGYQEKEVTIMKRKQDYKASDKIWVNDNSKVLRFSLAPGYVNVNVGEAYNVRIFEYSEIAVPINKVE